MLEKQQPNTNNIPTMNLEQQQQQQQKQGISRYNPIFEFQYTVENENVTMAFTSVAGHLMTADFDESHRGWHSCNDIDLFEAPIEKTIPQRFNDLKRQLISQAKKCDKLILWLDCDREGENIAFEVINVCRKANNNLNHHGKIKRARFSSLLPREIYNAIDNLVLPNENESDAVDARQEIDLRIGASFTRWQTKGLQQRFVQIDSVVSYGPCQFPTLGFVVEQYLRRNNFTPESFWFIQVTISTGNNDDIDMTDCNNTKNKNKNTKENIAPNYQKNRENSNHNKKLNGKNKNNKDDYIDATETAIFKWSRNQLFDHSCAVFLYELCIINPTAIITSVEHKPRNRTKPKPLDTIELQKRASRYLRLTSKRTMDIAEKLYQKGFLSYPRTETNKFPNGFKFNPLIQEQIQSTKWGQYANSLLNENKFSQPIRGNKDDKAHPPIHPTKYYSGNDNDEKRLYEFVVRHFLACCSENAKGSETRVECDIAGEMFHCEGLSFMLVIYFV